eukprot:Gregarina_sp_Poly_1__1144@NODE_127_length_13318_cov_461_829220_g113_i0_p3_GENE_NODE_127_length_13318_cov_461_829220_g113_i0NODE_127_length_13318_cov_461_829220_g113_i0_p3_ORF_typecomplete_len467_score77_44DUF3987/PF13148_6/0_19_NODE_127_length_13318_cov_461_829220_g113_i041965596
MNSVPTAPKEGPAAAPVARSPMTEDAVSKEAASRGLSFASTTIGSPLSATTEFDTPSPQTLRDLEEVFNRAASLAENDHSRELSCSGSRAFRTPVSSPVEPSASLDSAPDDASMLPSPLSSVKSPEHSLYISQPSKLSSLLSPGSISGSSWSRFRLVSCADDVRERRPSAADLISRYEAKQSDTYKEYRRWKESKWGEDALDEVEFEDDDVNLELSIPAVFSSPIIQLPSLGDTFRNIYDRFVGYMITLSDLLIHADYYVKHPKEIWLSTVSSFWLLHPTAPKQLVESLISVVCESSTVITEVQAFEMTTQEYIEESGMSRDPLMEETADNEEELDLASNHPEMDLVKQHTSRLQYLAIVQLKWTVRVVVFLVSIFVILFAIIATRIYDLTAACLRLSAQAFVRVGAIFDFADQFSWHTASWLIPKSEHNSQRDVSESGDDATDPGGHTDSVDVAHRRRDRSHIAE